MFLSERLKNILNNATDENKVIIDLLNECIAYISENTHSGMKAKDCAAVIKQANSNWKNFCKENNLESDSNLFQEAYINQRCKFQPQLKYFFK